MQGKDKQELLLLMILQNVIIGTFSLLFLSFHTFCARVSFVNFYIFIFLIFFRLLNLQVFHSPASADIFKLLLFLFAIITISLLKFCYYHYLCYTKILFLLF